MKLSSRHLCLLAIAAAPAVSPALYLNVTKDIYHYQPLYSTPQLDTSVPYYFTASAQDDQADGITNVTVTPPGGAAIPLEVDASDSTYFSFSDGSDDPLVYATGGTYANGTYTFGVTPALAGLDLTVGLTGNNFPDAPALADPYNADAFDATKTISLKILPYLGNVVDDAITVNIYDDTYTYVTSLTNPARGSTAISIPANTLSPGSTYYIAVTFYKAKAYTESPDGTFIKESYYSASTDFEIQTLAANAVYLPTQTLPDGRSGSSYTGTITGVTGTGPFTYSLVSGSLPPGLTLGPSTGTIAGTIGSITANATYEFMVKASNATGNYTAPFAIAVRPAGTGGIGPLTFFGLARGRYYSQDSTAATPIADITSGYYQEFFAEGFSSRGLGDVNVSMPASTNFAARARHLHRTYPLDTDFNLKEYADSQAQLDASFPPSASYTFNINARTSGSVTLNSAVNAGADSYPPAPVFTGAQPQIKPAEALPLTWSAWTTGKTGVQQFIQVSVIDGTTGGEVFATEAPFSAGPGDITLSDTATGVTIPANTLAAGKTYYVELSFYNVLTKGTVAVTGYNSATSLVARSAVTYLTLTSGANLESWASSNGLTSTDAASSADPDGDGFTNLEEYAFLGLPGDSSNPLATEFDALTDAALTAASPLSPKALVTTDPVAQSVTIRHPRRKNVDDLAYIYQTSPDCVTWSTVTPTSTTVLYQDDSRDLVDVVLPLTPESGKSNVFVRLKVELTTATVAVP